MAAVVMASKVTSTVVSGNSKMSILKAMNAVHKTKMFGRNNSEPLWKVFRRHPITRGMASYLVIWPTGNLIQQTLCLNKEDKYDWGKVVRFGLYGCFITAPCLYGWVRLATMMYPNNNLRLAMAKAIIEQISYTPFAMSTFFFSMTWLETFNAAEAFEEVRAKFPPTYFTAITIWPLIGTINFAFIPERNRVFFTSCFSLLWTIYLGYVQGATFGLDDESLFTPAGNVTLVQKLMFIKVALTHIITKSISVED